MGHYSRERETLSSCARLISANLENYYVSLSVSRRKEGLFVLYGLAGAHVFKLCDLMCGQLEAEAEAQRKLFATS